MKDTIVSLSLILFFMALFVSAASGTSLGASLLRASVVLLASVTTGLLLAPLFLRIWHYPKTDTGSGGKGSEAPKKSA